MGVKNDARPWTTAEIRLMREHAHLGAEAVARLLGRSVRSVQGAAARQRISLRRRGVRRGSVLGQPRGVSLRPEVRETLFHRGELVARRLRVEREAELCPCCAQRPQRVRVTGLCLPCHLERLAEAHREAQAEIEAQRRLWAERQRLHRAREERTP